MSEEVKELEKSKYMMATKAIHKMGDISSSSPDICFIHSETDENWIGNWVTGYGFIDVKFPKETTRELTEDEVKEYSSKYYGIEGHSFHKLDL